jgi:hypothetical protein
MKYDSSEKRLCRYIAGVSVASVECRQCVNFIFDDVSERVVCCRLDIVREVSDERAPVGKENDKWIESRMRYLIEFVYKYTYRGEYRACVLEWMNEYVELWHLYKKRVVDDESMVFYLMKCDIIRDWERYVVDILHRAVVDTVFIVDVSDVSVDLLRVVYNMCFVYVEIYDSTQHKTRMQSVKNFLGRVKDRVRGVDVYERAEKEKTLVYYLVRR